MYLYYASIIWKESHFIEIKLKIKIIPYDNFPNLSFSTIWFSRVFLNFFENYLRLYFAGKINRYKATTSLKKH